MTPSRSDLRRLAVLAVLFAASNCTDELPTGPSAEILAPGGRTNVLAIVSGNDQSGAAGNALPALLVVRLTHNGKGVKGAAIAFAVTAGGGQVSPSMAKTDAQGRASTTWTLGTTVGAGSVTASTATAAPATFTAQIVAGPPAQLAIVSGNNQTGIAGSLLANPLVVRVTDAYGNRVRNAQVLFAVTSGGGSLGTPTAVTDTSGEASTTWTLGMAAGANAAKATVGSLTPLTFAATGIAGAPAQLIKVSGDGQSGVVGTALANPLVVRVADANGNGVDGVTVKFSVAAGGGSVANASVTTAGGGLASTSLTLGPVAGANAATADVPGLQGVTFTATGVVGPPAQLVIVSGNNQSAVAGHQLEAPIVVRVNDASGNVIQGAVVAFAVTAGGGSVAALSVATDAMGQAATTWTLGQAGVNQVSATVAGIPGVLFSASATEPPVVVTLVSGTNQSAMPGATLPAPLVVLVSELSPDPKIPGPPAVGVPVRFVVVQGGGSVSPASTVTDAQGYASTVLTLGPAAGTNEVQVQVTGGTTTPSFLAFALPPLAIVSGDNQTGVVGQLLPLPIVVRFVPGVTLSFSVVAGAGSLAKQSGVTDGNGLVQNFWTLGSAEGPNAVRVSVPSLPQVTPVTFHANGVPIGAPSRLVIVSGNEQTGGAGFALPAPLVVQVQDEHGVGVSGIAITFVVTAGGGSVSSATVTSDGGGYARTSWTLGAVNGPNAVEAAAPGVPPVTFTANGITPLTLVIVSGDQQVGIVGTTLPQPLAVQALQRHIDPQSPPGPPVGGVTISFAVVGGSILSSSSAVTGADGVASVSLTLGNTPEKIGVQASALGAEGPVAFEETAVLPGPADLRAVSGNNQSGIVGALLPQPLRVRVIDGTGAPLSGVPVTFTPGANSGSVDTPNAVTDGNGTASTSWTLGGVLQQTVSASVAGLPPRGFTALAAPRLAIYSGDQQTGGVGAPLAQPVAVRVTDLTGQPVPGVPVIFTVTGGGGTVAPAQATSTSGGLAQATWTQGPTPGPNALVARYPNPPAPFAPFPATATFTATGVVAGAPASLVILSGDGQTGGTGATLPAPLVARVADASGIGVGGVTVNFAAGEGGSAVPAVTTSDGSGRASTQWTLGPGAGIQTMTATASGLSPVRFSATAVAPSALVLRSADGQRVPVGESISFNVQVQDAAGAGMPGMPVSYSVVSGSGSIDAALVRTDVNGEAYTKIFLPTAAGTEIYQAEVPGLAPVRLTVFAVAGPPATLAIVSGDGQTAQHGTTLTQPIVARVTDGFGNPIEGVAVSFTPAPGSGSVSAADPLTDGGGLAEVEWTLGPAPGHHTVTASATGLPGVTFGATATAGPAVALSVAGGDGQPGDIGRPLAQPLTVLASDANGFGVSGETITFLVTSGDGTVSPAIATTDAQGHARTTWTVGSAPGTQTVQASSGSLAPVHFTADARGPSLTLLSGNNLTVLSGQPVTVVVRATGVGDVPLSGLTIDFQVVNGGGTVSADAVQTDGNGRATTSWTIGAAGPNRLSFSANGSITQFVDATGIAGPPAQLVIVSGDGQTAQLGTTLMNPIVARLADAFGNPLSGISIQASTPYGGSVFSSPAVTDGSGRVSFLWTLGLPPGTQTLSVAASGVPTATASASADPLTGPAVALLLGNNQVAQRGTVLPGQVAVQVVGVGGAPVVGVAVSFTVVQGGGIVTPDPVLTDGSGIARMPWILGPLPGSNTVKATAAGLGTVYFNATGL